MAVLPFIGRSSELKELRRLQSRKIANLVVIQGRRRIGKSRLVQEFAKGQKFYSFVGLVPNADTDSQTQELTTHSQTAFIPTLIFLV